MGSLDGMPRRPDMTSARPRIRSCPGLNQASGNLVGHLVGNLAAVRRPASGILAAAIAAGTLSTSGFAQGTGGRLPDPRRGVEVATWLETWLEESGQAGSGAEVGAEVGAKIDRLDAVWTAHESYLDAVERLRDGEIESWLERFKEESFGPATPDADDALDRAARQAAEHRRLFDRLAALEEAFWAETATAANLDEAALELLRARAVRERALDLQARRRFFGGVDPIDLAGLIERLDATPAEETSIRARLADHDRRLAEALAVAVESEFESSIRRAEQRIAFERADADRQAAIEAEIAAAAEEGRRPDLDSIVAEMVVDGLDVERPNARGADALLAQQLASLERLRGAISDERLSMLLAKLRHGGGDPLGGLFRTTIDPKIEAGEIDAETAAAIDAIREAYYRERAMLALELARLEGASRGGSMIVVGRAGIESRPESDALRLEELRRRLGHELPQQVRDRLSGVLQLEELEAQRRAAAARARPGRGGEMIVEGPGGGVGTLTLESVPAEGVEFGVAVVATLEDAVTGEVGAVEFAEPVVMSITVDGDGTLVFGGSAPNAPPLRPISRERFELVLADVALADELRVVADQLRLDASDRFEAILAELKRALEADAAAERPGHDGPAAVPVGGGRGADLERIDAALRECLEADRAMFESLEALLEAEAVERLAIWRDAREAELLAVVSGLREGRFDPDLAGTGPPWEPAHARLDAISLLLEAVPDAMGRPELREAIANHVRLHRDDLDRHWNTLRSLVPEIREARAELFSTMPFVAEGGDPETLMASMQDRQRRMFDADRQVRDARAAAARFMREELDRLGGFVPEDRRAAYLAAVRRAAWPDAVSSMPAVSALETARDLVGEDEPRRLELAAIERRYLAESDRLFTMLDALETPRRRRAEAADLGGFSPEPMGRWRSLSGRLRFRHGELDFETIRRLRNLVGPKAAAQIPWPAAGRRAAAPGGATLQFSGG